MNKIILIIQREYITRVRNKTFIILTLLAPFFYGLLIALPMLAGKIGEEKKTVVVSDASGKFNHYLKDNEQLSFTYPDKNIEAVKKLLTEDGAIQYALSIPSDFDLYNPAGIQLISVKKPGIGLAEAVRVAVTERVQELKMIDLKLDVVSISKLQSSNVRVETQIVGDNGLEKSSTGAAFAASFGGAILIYMFIFLYGAMVMRGVQEEKQNRVVEVLISSVKPFQLMMGKIVGISLVGLTQFAIWVILSVGVSANFGGSGGGMGAMILNAVQTLDVPIIFAGFFFYFICGYLLYAALFAAAASAVDSQAEMQQFMLPITIPLILGFVFSTNVSQNPDSTFAFWLSIFPLTSPVVMMARLPFGVPVWQLGLSAILLIGGFILTTWFASKIYRTGILMYGKKVNYREIMKWLFYKN